MVVSAPEPCPETWGKFAGSLHVLANKAYPSWSTEQRQDTLRNQFIQGVQSSSVQLHLIWEKPDNIDTTLEIAIQHEGVETSQKRLLKKRQKAEDLVIQERECDHLGTNTMAQRETVQSRQLKELNEQVQQLTEEVACLQASKQPATARSSIKCWGCGEKGHIRCNCSGRKQKINTQSKFRSNKSCVALRI